MKTGKIGTAGGALSLSKNDVDFPGSTMDILAGAALFGNDFDPGGLDMDEAATPDLHDVGAAAPCEATPNAAPPTAEIDARAVSARSIQPGCTQYDIKTWEPTSSKPHLSHLRAEIKRRDAEIKCDNWKAPQCADWLHKNAPPESGSSPAPAVPAATPAPSAAAATSTDDEDPGVDPAKLRWAARRHIPRLCHILNHHRTKFLTRDEKPKSRKKS